MIALAVLSLAQPAAVLTVDQTADALVFRFRGQHVTTYKHAGEVAVEKGTGTKPLAKPYFWPLHAPGEVPVTRAWPMVRGTPGETVDHFHQKSVWFCHGDVEPGWLKLTTKSADGRPGAANFWTEAAGHGRIVCVEVGGIGRDRPNSVWFRTRNEWRTADGVKLLDEKRMLSVTLTEAGVLLRFDIVLTASEGPVTFGDTKEGAMGVRVHDELRTQAKKGGLVTAADGTVSDAAKDNLPMWGQGGDWHDYSGTVDGKPAGLAVFDHPANMPRAAWHTRAYGLMAANPFGRAKSGFPLYAGQAEPVRLAKGESLRLRYAVYAHSGDVKAGKVAEAFAGFSR